MPRTLLVEEIVCSKRRDRHSNIATVVLVVVVVVIVIVIVIVGALWLSTLLRSLIVVSFSALMTTEVQQQ